MGRTCTICIHADREAIDAALVRGEPTRKIASRYESLSQAAVSRHGREHLPASLALAHEAEEVAKADDLLGQVRGLQSRTLGILERAEHAGGPQLRTALSAIREARGNLELLAKLLGELDERPVSVLISPEWVELRAVIVTALAPHQEARSAVLRAIEEAGDGK